MDATIVLYVLGGLVGIWFLTAWGFVAMSHAKAMRDKGHDFSGWSKYPIYVLLVLFAIADVLFNWTFGSVIFRELPREGFFTDRVDRHYYGRSGWRQSKAKYWAKILNAWDPGHV